MLLMCWRSVWEMLLSSGIAVHVKVLMAEPLQNLLPSLAFHDISECDMLRLARNPHYAQFISLDLASKKTQTVWIVNCSPSFEQKNAYSLRKG